jgi:acyl dehydratase
MELLKYKPRGLYFEEYEIGYKSVTTGRTITEGDIVRFAGLTGDFTQLHIDAAYSAVGPFGERIAHGLLVLSIALGLAVQTGMIEGTVIAFRELDWKFSLPVMIGDTIRTQIEVVETKPLPRLGGGNVNMKVSVLNQEDKVVNRGHWQMLVQSEPKD